MRPSTGGGSSDQIECLVSAEVMGDVSTKHSSDGCGGIITSAGYKPSWGYAGEPERLELDFDLKGDGSSPETVLGSVEFTTLGTVYVTANDACAITVDSIFERENPFLQALDTYLVGRVDCGDAKATSESGGSITFAPFDFVAQPTAL